MQTGTIAWFDATSGEGQVETDDGTLLYLHFTCIEGIDRNGYGWPTEADQRKLQNLAGMPCEFTIYQNIYSSRVSTLRFTK